jgi:ATP-dependent Zn protease
MKQCKFLLLIINFVCIPVSLMVANTPADEFYKKYGKSSPEQLKQIAYHEIGHYIVAHYQKPRRLVSKITIEPCLGKAGTKELDSLGSVHFFESYQNAKMFESASAFYERNLMMYLGGPCAERYFKTGEYFDENQGYEALLFQSGWQDDMKNAEKNIAKIASIRCKNEMRRNKLGMSKIDPEKFNLEIRKIRNEFYEKTMTVIIAHQEEFPILAEELLSKKTLSDREALVLLRKAKQ